MTLTPSEVASIASKLSVWEITEYVSEALVGLGCLGEYIAEYAKWPTGWTNDQKHTLGRRSLVLLIVGIGFGLLSLIQTNALSGEVIGSLGDQAEQAGSKAKLAVDTSDGALAKSGLAMNASGDALSKAGKAEGAASSALTLAQGARQEADSFEKDIASAMKQAADAEGHLKDALARAEAAATLAKGYEKEIADAKRDASEARALLTDARQLAEEARQRASEATAGVNRIEANRSLSNPIELSRKVKEFENTEYMFSGVFADEESIQLLTQIDEALRHAGWQRTKAPHQFPALVIFGKDDDDVHVVISTGIQISVDASESLAVLQSLPVEKLPQLVRAAVALNVELGSNMFPASEAKLVDVQTGTSKTIRIIVGKKP